MINIRSPASIAKLNTIKEVISTHDNLSDEDKKYSITFICNLIDKEPLNDKLYRFLLYSNKNTFTGLFSYCYNDFFDNAVKLKNEKVLKNMVLEIKEEAFFELFDNKLITADDKIKVLQITDHEFKSTKEAIEIASASDDIHKKILVGHDSFYEKVLQDRLYANHGIAVCPRYISNVYLRDKIKNCKSPKIFILSLWTLLNSVISSNINPATQEPFSIEVYNSIKNKYEIELKLVTRYLKTKK
jgi:hypothetical protein